MSNKVYKHRANKEAKYVKAMEDFSLRLDMAMERFEKLEDDKAKLPMDPNSKRGRIYKIAEDIAAKARYPKSLYNLRLWHYLRSMDSSIGYLLDLKEREYETFSGIETVKMVSSQLNDVFEELDARISENPDLLKYVTRDSLPNLSRYFRKISTEYSHT